MKLKQTLIKRGSEKFEEEMEITEMIRKIRYSYDKVKLINEIIPTEDKPFFFVDDVTSSSEEEEEEEEDK